MNHTKREQSVPHSDATRNGPSRRDVPVKDYPVFLVHSNWSLKRINDFLKGFGNGNIGSMHVDRDRNGEETNRTICLVDESVYAAMTKGGYTRNRDFSIDRYALRPNCYPSKKHAYSFYVPLPRSFKLTEAECRQQLEGKLNELVAFGVLGSEDFVVRIPQDKDSEQNGDIKPFCFVTFKRSVDHDTIAIVKVALDSSWWYPSDSTVNRELTRCYWGRRRPLPERSDGGDGQEESGRPRRQPYVPRGQNRDRGAPMARTTQPHQRSMQPDNSVSEKSCANPDCKCNSCECNPCNCSKE